MQVFVFEMDGSLVLAGVVFVLTGICSPRADGSSVPTSEEKIIICRPRDFSTAFAEDPDVFHEGSCPTTPSPDEVPDDACHQCECWSDANCDPQEKCCHNGCKNTCTDSVIVAPAPVIDWIDEPPRQRTAGNAWLIPGPEEPYAAETCTTTFFEDGGDPLKCPTGYFCHIRDEGDVENGVPNSGICVRE